METIQYTLTEKLAKTDRRIKNLSYSSLLTLHSCPRKFQLYKLGAAEITDDGPEDSKSSVTFAVGHMLGTGIQNILSGDSVSTAIFKAFLDWPIDLWAENKKDKKSFFHSILALQQIEDLLQHSFLADYELVYYEGKPACELSFSIELPNGFHYRGSVDAVLVHKLTGKIIVLELKSTKYTTISPSTYKNSAQAIGYSIVLDSIFPEISGYDVLYLVYSTVSQSYTPITFEKSYYQRALWIRELLLDIDTISLYENADIYPMHGESCFSFFRNCEYLNTCTLSTEVLTEKLSHEALLKLEGEQETKWQIKVTLNDLITSQLTRESTQNVTSNSTAKPSSSSTPATTEDILL